MRKWLRRGLLGLLWGLLAVVGSVSIVMALALYTRPGTAIVVPRVLDWYNGRIPGQIVVESFDGRLGTRLTIDGLQLLDRNGKPLLSIEAAEVNWQPLALVTRELRIHRLDATDVGVWIPRPESTGTWADLAPPGPDEPKEGLGPEFGIAIVGELSATSVRLVQGRGEGSTALLMQTDVLGEVFAEGRRATVEVRRASGRLPSADLEVMALSGSAAWDEPVASLSDLEAETSKGAVQVPTAELDLGAKRGSAVARGQVSESVLEELAGRPMPGDGRVAIDVQGSLEDLEGDLELSVGDALEFAAQIGGAIEPELDLRTRWNAVVDPDAYLARDVPATELRGTVELSGPSLQQATATAELRCTSCPDHQPVSVQARASRDAARGSLSASVDAVLAGLQVEGRADMRDGALQRARFRVETDDLEGPIGLANRFVDVPPAAGALNIRGTCNELAGRTQCSTRLQGQSLELRDIRVASLRTTADVVLGQPLWFSAHANASGVKAGGRTISSVEATVEGTPERFTIEARARGEDQFRVALAGEVGLGPPLWVHLRQLRGRARTTDVRLEHPTTITVADAVIGIDDLRMQVGRGRLLADGRIAPRGSSDLGVEVQQLHLQDIEAFVPNLKLAGRVDLQGHLRGTLARPRFDLKVEAVGIRHDDNSIGDWTVTADYHPGRLEAGVNGAGAWVERVQADASVPMTLAMNGGFRWRIRHGRPFDVQLVVQQLDLEQLGPYMPELETTGRLDVDAKVRGGRKLAGELEVTAERLKFREQKIGHVHAEASYVDREADAELEIRGPVARQIKVEGHVPLHLTTERVRWLPQKPHRVHARIVALRLGVVGEILDVPEIEGSLTADASVRGHAANPRAELRTRVGGLKWDRRDLGTLVVGGSYEGDLARVDATLRRDPRHYVSLVGKVPVTVDVQGRDFTWHEGQEHFVRLTGQGIDQHMLRPLVDLPEQTRFAVSLIVEGKGNASDFSIDGDASGRLVHGDMGAVPIEFELEASPEQQKARLTLGPKGPMVLRTSVHTKASVGSLRRGHQSWRDIPVQAKAEIPRMRLEPLGPMLPVSVHEPEGKLQARVRAEGTLGRPVLSGQAMLADGGVTVVPIRQRLRDIHLKVDLHDRVLELQKLRLESGRGSVEGSGRMRFGVEGPRGRVRLVLKDFPVVRPGMPYLLVSSELEATLEAPKQRTDIDLIVRDTRVDVYDRNIPAPNAIPASERVVYVDAAGRSGELRREHADPPSKHPSAGTRESTTEEADSKPLVFTVSIPEPLVIFGGKVDMSWQGKIELHKRGQQSDIDGAIRAKGGVFEFLGNQFDIRKGRVTLSDSADGVNPYLDVVATTDHAEAQVTVTIRGRASEPKLELSSEPPMSESQIFTLLVTGSTHSSGASNGEVQSKAANLLATFNNPALRREMKDTLGIDRAGIGFGENVDQPILTVGKRIGRKVFVETEYHHNAPEDENDAEVRLRYRFRPGWVLETFFGNVGQGGVDLYWRRRFGGPEPPADDDQEPPKQAKSE